MRLLPVSLRELPRWLRHRLPTYLSTTTWLARDLFARNLGLSLLLIALSITAVVAKLLTFVVLASFAQAAVAGEQARFRGADLPFDADGRGLALAIAATASLAITAAVAAYGEGRMKLALGQRYARRTVRRIAERIASLRSTPGGVPVPDVTYLQRLVGSDAIILFRLVQPATGLILPSIQTLAMLALMLWIDPILSTMLLVVGVVYFLPFVRINRDVVRAAADLEDGRQGFVDQNRRTAHGLLLDQYPHDLVATRWLEGAEFNRLLDATSRLLGNRYVVQLANDLFFAAIALLLVIYISMRTSNATDSLTSLVVYVVIARYAYGSISTMTRSFAAVNRFLPQFQRYSLLLKDEPTPDADVDPWPPTDSDVVVEVAEAGDVLEGTRHRLEMEPGSVTAVVGPQSVDPLSLSSWWFALVGEAVPRRVFFVPPDALAPDICLTDLLGERSSPRDDGLGDHEPPEPSAEVLAVCQHLQRDVVVMNRVTWNDMSDPERSAFKDRLSGARLVISWDHVPGSMDPLVDAVVVLDATSRVAGAGNRDWFAASRQSVTELFAAAMTGPSRSNAGLDDVLLDDDLL